MRKTISILLLVFISVFVWSCDSGNGSSGVTNSIIYTWDNATNGCPIVLTLDGANPVTVSAIIGTATVYTNLTKIKHAVVITVNSAAQTCTVDMNKGTQTIVEHNVCSASPTLNCP